MPEMTDTQLLQWLCNNLEWDGFGYWLPDVCIKPLGYGEDARKEPTIEEFRDALIEKIKEKT